MNNYLICYTHCYQDADNFIYPDMTDCIIEAESEEEAKSKFYLEHRSYKHSFYKIDHIELYNN